MSENEDRLTAIEERLVRVERALNLAGTAPTQSPASSPAHSTQDASEERPAQTLSEPLRNRVDITTTKLMAWAASVAFVLAAGYFVKLVYDAGWLTPERQIGLALLVGIALVAGGLLLAEFDRDYAAYMPSVGVVVLYLAIYTGQVRYELFGPQLALLGVAGITFAAIWLGRRFDNSMYALVAVAGTYVTPLLIHAMRTDLTDLVVYFTAWGLLFSFVSLHEGRRLTYLVALYFAILGFDIAFRLTDESAWKLAASFQFAQFLFFAFTATLFSIRHKQVMHEREAIVHGVALFYFYVIEYILLKEHLPEWAPIIALVSVGVVLGLFLFGRSLLKEQSTRASGILVSCYCAVVTAHVLFFELLPDEWVPWAALMLPVGAAFLSLRLGMSGEVFRPVLIVATLMFCMGYIDVLTADSRSTEIPLPGALLVLYAASLYLAYALFRRRRETYVVAPVTLFAAHAAFLAATIRLIDSGFMISIAWSVFAMVLLVYAVRRRDKTVGQSSLVIFAASGIKVLLFDLSEAAPMVRVLTLVVLAVSLYAGGWLYQQMSKGDMSYHPKREINDQLNVIRSLAEEGLRDVDIVDELERRGIPCLVPEGEWSATLVSKIRKDYGFA